MDPVELRDFEAKLGDWLGQGYQVLADDVDGELRLTTLFVPVGGDAAREREQEYWPMTPEIVDLLSKSGVPISRAMAGP
jgi:hypothetical protein